MTVLLVVGVLSPAPAAAAPTCVALQARTVGTRSVLYRVSLPSGSSTEVRLGAYLDALGYSAAEGVTYGLATGFREGAHAVTVRPNGQITDLGAVRGHGFQLPAGGTISGNRWYVVENDVLYTVDVTALRVIASVRLDSPDFDDLDVDPSDGRLYAVSDVGYLVRIDPRTGRTTPVVALRGLPLDRYPAVVFGEPRWMYVAAHAGGLYRVGRDGSVRRLGSFPAATRADLAGCLAAPPSPPAPPPVPPPPVPPPPQPPRPTPTTTPTATSPPRPTPIAPRPSAKPRPPAVSPTTRAPSIAPTPSRPAEPSATPTPPRPRHARWSAPEEPSTSASPTTSNESGAEPTASATKEKRRWSVALLVLVVGAGAALRRLRR